jgi:hypothetical protein
MKLAPYHLLAPRTGCGSQVLEKLMHPWTTLLFRSPSLFYLLVHSRCKGVLFSLDHTQAHTTIGTTPLDEGSARRRDLYLTTQTLYKRQTCMSPVGFEPMISASARSQAYALDRAATENGELLYVRLNTAQLGYNVTKGTEYFVSL